jgi:hypothetical protein
MAPVPEINHPNRLNVPKLAKLAGSINIPEATILPTTKEVPVQSPNLVFSFAIIPSSH